LLAAQGQRLQGSPDPVYGDFGVGISPQKKKGGKKKTAIVGTGRKYKNARIAEGNQAVVEERRLRCAPRAQKGTNGVVGGNRRNQRGTGDRKRNLRRECHRPPPTKGTAHKGAGKNQVRRGKWHCVKGGRPRTNTGANRPQAKDSRKKNFTSLKTHARACTKKTQPALTHQV